MRTLKQLRGELIPLQGVTLADGRPRYLFRGQVEQHRTIVSRFSRLPADDVLMGQAYTVYRYARQICQGLRGYSIGHLDGVAVLQHYGWPTPLIDFSGVLEVAVFFALFGATPKSEAVIYVLDRESLPDDAEFVDHDFLTNELSDGGLRHRWLRQDGFAITPRDWRMADTARSLNLLADSFRPALDHYAFQVSDDDTAEIADVLDQQGDPIPENVQNLLRIFCEHQFGDELHPHLQKIIDAITTDERTNGA